MLIQSSGTANLSVGSTSVTWGQNTTNGNMIVVGVNLTNAAIIGTVSSISDSQGNSYTKITSGTFNGITDVINAEVWYAQNIIGGAGSVTVNHTIDACAIYAREYSGGFNYIDVTNAAGGSSTATNSGTSAISTNPQELIINVIADDKGTAQTWTSAGGYGNPVGTSTTITSIGMQDITTSTAGAQTGTLTLGAAANWESIIVAFRQLNNPRLTPQGMGGM